MSSSDSERRLIAVEEHFATDAFYDALETLAVPAEEKPEREFMLGFARNPQMRPRFTEPQALIDTMDEAGIDISVVSLNPPGVQIFADPARASALSRELNDALADRVRRDPARLHGLGCLAPQDPSAAAAEIARIMGSLGFGGVLIGSSTHGRYLDEPEFEPILAALEEHDATLYLHPRSPSPPMLEPYKPHGLIGALWGFQAEVGLHAIRLITSGALDRHPKLRIVLGHLGEALPFWLWRLDNIYRLTYGWAGEALGMTRLELTPSEYIKRNFSVTTSGMYDPQVMTYVVQRLGAENVMFAVDYPYEDSGVATSFLAAADLNDRQRALISHQNAQRLFPIPG